MSVKMPVLPTLLLELVALVWGHLRFIPQQMGGHAHLVASVEQPLYEGQSLLEPLVNRTRITHLFD